MSRVERDALVAYLDRYLEVDRFADKSLNGLQVEGAPQVERVAMATDAALAVFAMAIESGSTFLVVHHGLFWGEVVPVTGVHRTRLATLLDAGLSVYASHLPLDAHPEVGNNAVLARLLELDGREPFGRYGESVLGFRGALPEPMTRADLDARLEALLGARPQTLPFGPETVRSIAVVSGGAASMIPEAAATGVDAFITGETSHIAFHDAREHRLNVVFCGHYASETLGVRALGEHLSEKFGVETVFLDAPTGY